MIYLLGATAAIATANAAPPPVTDYLTTLNAAYPVGNMNYNPGFQIVIGTLFTAIGTSCTGIEHLVALDSGTDPNDIRFDLWSVVGSTNLASETIPFAPSMFGTKVSTTGAFAPLGVPLIPGQQYIASVSLIGGFGPFPYSQIVPLGYLPISFPTYTVGAGAQVFAGAFVGFPATNDPAYAAYVQPVIS
jgi:hypothetical protein